MKTVACWEHAALSRKARERGGVAGTDASAELCGSGWRQTPSPGSRPQLILILSSAACSRACRRAPGSAGSQTARARAGSSCARLSFPARPWTAVPRRLLVLPLGDFSC